MNERSRTISGSHHHHHHPPPLQRARAGTVGTASAAPYQSTQQAPAAPAASRDRLFRSHLIRRPTGGGGGGVTTSATSTSSMAAAATHADAALLAAEEQQHQAERCEIVVRNHNGDIDLEGSPVVSLDDIDEMALEARHETEQERQRLAEAVKQHRINHTTVPDQPEEAVRASLRAKVNALADDHWMFDPEDPPRG
ncbi:hypothetical protein ARSEF1564_000301 [Beauveria bassiana]